MSADGIPLSERMTSAFVKLADSAKNSTGIAADVGRYVDIIERALDGLHLNVACWTLIVSRDDGDRFEREYVGYGLCEKTWRLLIQTSEGSDNNPDESRDITWPFNEAPLYLRVKAVDKLPDLVEALAKVSDATAERMKNKVVPVRELALAIQNVKYPPKK